MENYRGTISHRISRLCETDNYADIEFVVQRNGKQEIVCYIFIMNHVMFFC